MTESEQDNVISLSLPAKMKSRLILKPARDNTYELLSGAMGAVQELLQIASYSQDHEALSSHLLY